MGKWPSPALNVFVLLLVLVVAPACQRIPDVPRAPGCPRVPDGLRVCATQDWQSAGVEVRAGDVVTISAEGTWLYTPGEYHGPEGHAYYSAPGFYPLPGVPGGALIGRIGEEGEPFYVGCKAVFEADASGVVYLRIDDDILSDNAGCVRVEVIVGSGEDQDSQLSKGMGDKGPALAPGSFA